MREHYAGISFIVFVKSSYSLRFLSSAWDLPEKAIEQLLYRSVESTK